MQSSNTIDRSSAKAGQALVMITLGVFLLFGILGLVVDLGYSYFVKQSAQAAADAAALAGAGMANDLGNNCGNGVVCQSNTACPSNPTNPPATNFDAACLYAKANGFGGGANQTVTLSGGSGNPPNVTVTSNYWIQATATQTNPLGFLRIFGFKNAQITAQATSATVGAASGGCIWILDPIAAKALDLNGSSNIISNCGIHINSSASNALNMTGGAILSAASVNVVGGASITNNSSVTPAPYLNQPAAPDPLANLPSPPVGSCDYTNVQLGGGTTTLTPGVYCGGIKISAQAVVNFSPGTYILNGGGMQVTSSYATLNGSGVFFYNTASGYSFGAVDIESNATVNLTPPTSGTYRGILLFQDRNINSSATTAFGGGSNEFYSGAVYLPTGYLQFVGGSSTQALTMALIAKDLSIAGNAYLAKDTTGATGVVQSSSMLVQ